MKYEKALNRTHIDSFMNRIIDTIDRIPFYPLKCFARGYLLTLDMPGLIAETIYELPGKKDVNDLFEKEQRTVGSKALVRGVPPVEEKEYKGDPSLLGLLPEDPAERNEVLKGTAKALPNMIGFSGGVGAAIFTNISTYGIPSAACLCLDALNTVEKRLKRC